MKKARLFFQLIGLGVLAISLSIASCTKEGPMGPAGADGTDGKDGVDGNSTCLACHGQEIKTTIEAQFSQSVHVSGLNAVDYAGGRASCAKCHSHQGYVEFAETGTVSGNISNPTAWECATCHSLHETMEAGDYALRLNGAVTLITDNTTVVDEGNNNTCLNCHQSRRNGEYYDKYTEDQTFTRKFTGDDIAVYQTAAFGPAGSATLNATSDTLTVVFDVPTTHVYISSTHAGPHLSSQGNTWIGVGGYTAAAGTMFSGHSDGCVKCHMGEASGHSFKPELDNCTSCHGEKDVYMDAIADRVEAIGVALEAIHAIHEEDGEYHPMYASITREQFQAFWNFMILLEDRSNGAHNPTYVEALLDQAEALLGL
ncbi:hypothetical protein [Marinifilum sp. D737]|uniref:hypothetical protein n=1 Tax=Marinifilum sp. D737 TaxID=2969628 RepID=UPI002275638C|nr:hypothetical protein [Marinifilum sp. D737]MCY1634077.1 hypothetical protein [Marinifilum sp. D737]